jgi:hypothetical protein
MTESSGQYHDQRLDAWIKHAINFFVLANAGAAVATLTFLGSRQVQGCAAGLTIASLFFFVLGLVVAGTAIMGQVTGAYRALLTAETDAVAADHFIKKGWITRHFDKAEPISGTLLASAFALFIVGSLVGLVSLIAAAT